MKNLSIRTRILAGVVLVNLIGALVVVVYLHQAFSGELEVAAQNSVVLSSAAWQDIAGSQKLTVAKLDDASASLVTRMKNVTRADYGLLIDKTALNQQAYAKWRESKNLANNWDERDAYVLVAATGQGLAEKMQLKTAPGDVPETGRIVGIENGACSKTCHGGVKGSGDFWGVSWSTDLSSRAHAVVPVNDGTGKPIGVAYSIADLTSQANGAKASTFKTLGVFGATLLVATLLIWWMLDGLIFKRLAGMIRSMEDLSMRVAGGDFDATFEPDGTSDEIGRFEEFFAKFLGFVSTTLKSLVVRE